MGRHSHDMPCTWQLSCVKALVDTGWAISLLFNTNGRRRSQEKHSLVGEP